MNIDPNDPSELDGDELKMELDREMSDLSPEDLNLMHGADAPAAPTPDEKGRVHGRIISVRGADVFVDIGSKSEAFLAIDEFAEDEPPEPGREHSFVMQGIDRDSGLMRLSLRQARLEADFESLQIGDVIEARVTGVNLGGLELMAKNLRAFMPKSQVDLDRIEDFTGFISRRLECQVTEIDRRNKTLVVSRRKLLERDREEMRQELKYSLAEGQSRTGIVRRLAEYGAFVDLGGIDGLLHVKDMSYGRVAHPRDVVKEGDEIEVQVLKIDLVKDRISLGLKQLQPDPWNVVEGNYRVGMTVPGKVVKLENFGAFVQLQEGVEGLIRNAELSWTQRVRHPKDIVAVGDNVQVKIIEVDLDKRRVALSLRELQADPWNGADARYATNSITKGAVTSLTDYGAFVQIEDGIEGLVHISEMSDQRVRTPGDVVKVGDVIEVRVKSIDMEQRRVSLSMKGIGVEAGSPAAGAPAPAAPPKKKRDKPLKGGLDF